MIERSELKHLDIEQLVALALYTEEYNIRFFRSWANRLKTFDPGIVRLLEELAADSQQYRDTLYETSCKLFQNGLPELQPELYFNTRRNLELPDYRYFVVSEQEARSILNAALTLQRDTIELLTLVDNALHRDSANDSSDETGSGHIGDTLSDSLSAEPVDAGVHRRLQ
jgi:rubrerythrin